MITKKLFRIFFACLALNITVCVATDTSSSNSSIELSSVCRINSEIDNVFSSKKIVVGEREFKIIVDSALKSAFQNKNIKEEDINAAIRKIQRGNPSRRVCGYTLGIFGNSVTVEGFCGDNAK